MEKINLPLFYDLGSHLNALTKLNPETSDVLDIIVESIDTQFTIKSLLQSFPILTVSRAAARQLSEAIDELIDTGFPMPDKPHDPARSKFRQAVSKAKEFETILIAELQTLATYHVTQKAIYSTTDLVDRAENIFLPPTLQKLGPEVLEEVRQSGRCLAFEIATASAFHMMRATELVMREYYISVCKPTAGAKTKLDNWGAYITELKNSPAPEVKEVVAILQQIKDRHRNPIMHPEVVLSPDEAFTLFEIAKAAIIVMADQLPPPKKP